MLESGYIKLFRSFLQWEWYSDPNTARLFLHLILTANHHDKEWCGITIKRGQRVCSYEKLAYETSLTVKNVRTALSHLIRTNEVAYSSTRKYGLVTVNNYDKYQDVANEVATNENATGQHDSSLEADKWQQSKKARKQEYIYPPIIPLTNAKKETIFEDYAEQDAELLEALHEFEKMRISKKSPMTARAKTLLVGKLDSLSANKKRARDYKISCLNEAIVNSWKSVYELKDFDDAAPTRNPKEELPPLEWLSKENPTIEEILGVDYGDDTGS